MLNKRCITVLRYIKSYSKLRTQNPSKSLKITLLSEKGDKVPKVRQQNTYLTLIYIHV